MTESKIQGLAKSADSSTISPNKDTTHTTDNFSAKQTKVPYSMYSFFELTPGKNKEYDSTLESIYDYIKKDKSELSDGDLLMAVKDIELKLGYPRIGENRINRLNRYVRLQGRIKDMEKQRDAMFRGF